MTTRPGLPPNKVFFANVYVKTYIQTYTNIGWYTLSKNKNNSEFIFEMFYYFAWIERQIELN